MTRLNALVAVSFALGGLLYALALRTESSDARQKGWLKYWVYLAIVAAVLTLGSIGTAALAAMVTLIGIFGAAEIHRARDAAGRAGKRLSPVVFLGYLIMAALAVAGVWLAPPKLVVFVFAVVAAFDGASEVSGRLFGRRRISPVVSPNKTVEGLLGGLIVAAAVAGYLAGFPPLPLAIALVAGPVIGIIALCGDLSKSWIKRRAGLKDFGELVPGHGGVLDRFDGFLPNCAVLAFLAFGNPVFL